MIKLPSIPEISERMNRNSSLKNDPFNFNENLVRIQKNEINTLVSEYLKNYQLFDSRKYITALIWGLLDKKYHEIDKEGKYTNYEKLLKSNQKKHIKSCFKNFLIY